MCVFLITGSSPSVGLFGVLVSSAKCFVKNVKKQDISLAIQCYLLGATDFGIIARKFFKNEFLVLITRLFLTVSH